MKKTQGRYSAVKRLFALVLAFVMVAGYFPTTSGWKVSAAEPGTISTVADPETLTRPTDIYGSNTLNAGKVTVGKSVATHNETVKLGTNDKFSFKAEENNFTVTISQFAQVMGLSSETSVPVDVVFVLDTSGSMGYNNTDDKTGRAEAMVNAANSAIATLLAANEYNRVSVVAFSSEGYGQGTSDDDAANVLSTLYHYTGNAASKHLQWVNNNKTAYTGSTTNTTSTNFGVGSSYYLIGGRTTTGAVNETRNGGNGGTNIHAGIALGAQQLTSVTDTTVTYEDGTTVTRMPFIVLLSDGAPTFSSSTETWYNPSQTAEQGPGSRSYAGNGFLAALTAAYYKGAITEHYYGSKADSQNRCSIYTIGVQLDSLSEDGGDRDLAEVTMNPKQYLSDANNTFADEFNSYWDSYKAGTGNFNILVNYEQEWKNIGTNRNPNWQWVDTDPVYYSIRRNTITATTNYVNGKNAAGETMYTGGIAYNDGYYNASQTSQIAGIFQNIVNEISKKAISSPTHVTTSGENFSGYVHFSDPIGEYMEVKAMKGIVIGDYFYQGASFAQLLETYGSGSAAQNEFDQLLRDVLDERMRMSGSNISVADFVKAAVDSDNQAYYESATDFDNSIVWWGSDYVSGNGQQLQVLGNADNDTVAYIESAKAADAIPDGAKYVCRSYFFYGTAGGADPNANHEFMHFMLRVQRSLEAPYQETVVISCPASLLSVEEVLITENADGSFSASVETASPARVVYEVGLRSDINPQNVDQIISETYKSEDVEGTGSVNYSNGTYNFFTNDWDRTQSNSSHHRALTEATFEAAVDNPFYTYQQDTLLLDANGNAAAYDSTNGGTYYYKRTYYDWSNATLTDGIYNNVDEKTELIKVELSAGLNLTVKDGKYYIPAGVYAASTLQTTGDDVIKGDNPETEAVEKNNVTGTSEIVSHAHRTNSATDNHYTVKLGNNGMLSIVADPPKSVSIGNSGTNDDGKTVMVGDILTYTIKVVNNEGTAATAVVTDSVPTGTKLVAGSITNGGTESNGTITWNLSLAKGETKVVSFKVEVLSEALAGEQNVQNITNTGTIKIGNNPAYSTNTTTNPPEGKKVVDENGVVPGNVQVGDILTYRIRFYNDTNEEATVTVKDIVPAGTTFVSADHGGQLMTSGADAGKIVWTIANVQPGHSGVVSFDVKVDASAKQTATGTQPESGEISITNNATIQIGTNGPEQTTNTTVTKVKTGNVAVKKIVTNTDKRTEVFNVVLIDTTGKLNGTYVLSKAGAQDTVTFTVDSNGRSVSQNIVLAHDQTATVYGLPEGTVIYVEEYGLTAGWSASYADTEDGDADEQRVIVSNAATKQVDITNTYRVKAVTFQLSATKKFTGENFPAGSFTFTVKEVNADGSDKSGAATLTGIASAAQNQTNDITFNFSPIEFTEAATKYFLVDETSVNVIPGVTNSPKQYLLRVKIEDKDAQLVATITGYKERTDSTEWTSIGWTESTPTVEFTNAYKPAEVSLTFEGTKTLTGRVMADNEFGFELVEVITHENASPSERVVSTALVKADSDDAHGGTFSFDPVTFTSTGTYKFKVREVQGTNDRITYDDDFYTITVTVTDSGAQLVATVTGITKYDKATDSTSSVQNPGNTYKYAFANTFTPVDVSVSLSGDKTLTGEAATELKAEDFTFVIYEANSSFVADATKPVAGTGNAAGTGSAGNLTGAIAFSDISYTAAMLKDVAVVENSGVKTKTKDFYYVAKEVVPGATEPSYDRNMKYDNTEYQIHIQVVQNLTTGEMTVTVVAVNKKVGDTVTPVLTGGNSNSFDGLKFANIKNPATVTYRPTGTKTTNGGTAGLKFSFRVLSLGHKQGTNDAVWYEEAERKLEATGISAGDTLTNDEITFTNLVYDADDVGMTYYYLIEEATAVTGNMVSYDDTQFVLEVMVGRDSGNALTVTPVYHRVAKNTDGTNKDAADPQNWEAATTTDFTNTYSAHASLNITATKKLTGSRPLAANEFDFRLQLLEKSVDGSNVTYSLPQIGGSVVDGINSGAVNTEEKTNTINFGTLIFTDKQIGDQYLVATETADNGDTVKTYQYNALMSEIVPESAKIPGVTYDAQKYIVTIQWIITVPADSGVAPSYGQPAIVEVNEADGSNGVYTKGTAVTFNGTDTGIVFNNSYTPTSTTVTIEATKTLTGRDLKAGEFAFELFRGDALIETATNNDKGLVVFTRTYPSSISESYFTADSDNDGNKEATFTYTLKEVQTSKGGVTYSDAQYTIDVVIEHDTKTAALTVMSVTYKDKNGNVITDGSDDGEDVDEGEILFNNTYTSTTAYYIPVANKILKGEKDEEKALGDNLYSFEIVELNHADWSEKGVASIGANKANAVEFSPISFSHRVVNENPHFHYYAIREVKGTDPNVEYDDTVYYMAVEIYDDGAGTLYVLNAKYYAGTDAATAFGSEPVYTEVFYQYNENATDKLTDMTQDGKPAVEAGKTPVTFTNYTGPGYVNVALELNKIVEVHGALSYEMKDSQFDFTVTMLDGTYVTSGTNDASGKITFGTITHTGEGDYIYKIVEEQPSTAGGITIHTTPIYAHVKVVRDNARNLSYNVSYRDSDQWMQGNEINTFTNTYTATAVELDIIAHKHLEGKHLAAGEFEFVLFGEDNATPVQDADGNEMIVTNDADGNVKIPVKFVQEGTYTFYLHERNTVTAVQNGSAGTYKFDSAYFKIEVEVADDTQGKLYIKSVTKTEIQQESTSTEVTAMEFHNTFTPGPLTVDLTTDIGGTKSVVDAEGNIRNELVEGFEFRILDIQNNPAITDTQGNEVFAKSNANGQIVIPSFTFKEAGEYHYWMFEKDTEKPYTKDAAIFEIHILVHQNTSSTSITVDGKTVAPGELYVISSEVMTFAYSDVSAQADGADEDAVVFVNKYEPTPVTVTITADKTLTGRDMKAGEFTFHLVEVYNDKDDHLIRAETTNEADGDVVFTLTYVTTGEHTYSIHEHAPADDQKAGGVSYDTKDYGQIKVTVKEVDGKLVVEQGKSIASGVTIKNSYTAKPVTAVVEANKILTGGLALKADDFTFQLKDEEGNVVDTAKNTADGKIKLEVPFEHKDLDGQISKTFAYTIHEVKGEIPGVVYDETAYKVFITVTDDLQGNLVYTVAYEIGMAPTFHNVYETDDAVVTIKAAKKLVGNTLKGDDFQFLLLDKDGNEVATAKNAADGKIIFNFTVAESGTYEYTIVEKAGDDSHIVYDLNSYKVTVEVKDDGKGQLVAGDPVYKTESGKEPVFENTYNPDGIVVHVDAIKKFTGGKTLKADAFEFQLLDKDGEVAATAKNSADGKIRFDLPIKAAGEYTYTMTEKAGTDSHITYDAAKYTVTVKVENNGEGELEATVTYGTTDGKVPVFTNTYKPDKIGVTLKGTKTLTGRDMKAGEFKFEVRDTTGTLVATGTNDAEGKITFTPVGIVIKGTYLLTVSEVKGNADYVTYDKSTFQVKVVVENVDGVLVSTVTYVDGDIEFENSYDEPANPETGDEMPIYWLIGLLILSAAAIVLLIIFRPRKGGKYLSK